jgi:hypothetical protein
MEQFDVFLSLTSVRKIINLDLNIISSTRLNNFDVILGGQILETRTAHRESLE